MSENYPTQLDQLVKDDHGQPLVCHGCAHSAGAGYPFPGRPSGERPCCFCVRNVEREQWIANAKVAPEPYELPTVWYDGSPAIKVPMDNYATIDRDVQYQKWEKAAVTKAIAGMKDVVEKAKVLPMKDGDVLVLTTPTSVSAENMEHLISEIIQASLDNQLPKISIIWLTEGMTLEALDVNQMAAAGWMRECPVCARKVEEINAEDGEVL